MRWPPWRRTVEPSWTSGLPAGVTALVHRLPDPETLRRRCRGLAMLEAVLSTGWEGRRFHFDAHRGLGQQLASMRDGSGDEWSITFTPVGAWLRGLGHESPMNPWGDPHDLDWLEQVPEPLRAAAAEPAFTGDVSDGEARALPTCACWWLYGHGDDEHGWHPVQLRRLVPTGVEDGAGHLFTELDGRADTYLVHAEHWHDVSLRREDVEHVLALGPLTEEVVRRVAPQRALADLDDDIEQIGYPRAR